MDCNVTALSSEDAAMTDTSSSSSWSDKFLKFLNEIEPLGTYATHGNIQGWPPFLPNVSVEGVGRVSFPLMDLAVEAIKAVATRASFGRGEESLYDERVRKGWEIDADKIEMGDGEVWDTLLRELVNKVCKELGISSESGNRLDVKAVLYKLLLYEEGGHFAPHRDSEKQDGMFGTLIIQLPSRFTGGSFTVHHGDDDGHTKTFELAEDCDSQIKYTAFYADVQHQLHPVTSGVRICLVYNLVAAPVSSASIDASRLSHTNNTSTARRLRAFADEWMEHSTDTVHLGYQLAHQYTPDSFGFDAMKGRDEIVLQTLLAAKTLDGNDLFNIHLLMMERQTEFASRTETIQYIRTREMLDRNGDDVLPSWRGWNMFRRSDGWLVKEGLFDCETENDTTKKSIDSTFVGKASKEEIEYRYLGFDDAPAPCLLWYYASAIVISIPGHDKKDMRSSDLQYATFTGYNGWKVAEGGALDGVEEQEPFEMFVRNGGDY